MPSKLRAIAAPDPWLRGLQNQGRGQSTPMGSGAVDDADFRQDRRGLWRGAEIAIMTNAPGVGPHARPVLRPRQGRCHGLLPGPDNIRGRLVAPMAMAICSTGAAVIGYRQGLLHETRIWHTLFAMITDIPGLAFLGRERYGIAAGPGRGTSCFSPRAPCPRAVLDRPAAADRGETTVAWWHGGGALGRVGSSILSRGTDNERARGRGVPPNSQSMTGPSARSSELGRDPASRDHSPRTITRGGRRSPGRGRSDVDEPAKRCPSEPSPPARPSKRIRAVSNAFRRGPLRGFGKAGLTLEDRAKGRGPEHFDEDSARHGGGRRGSFDIERGRQGGSALPGTPLRRRGAHRRARLHVRRPLGRSGISATRSKRGAGASLNCFIWMRTFPLDNYYAHPVEGLHALIDLATLEILEVEDHFEKDGRTTSRCHARR